MKIKVPSINNKCTNIKKIHLIILYLINYRYPYHIPKLLYLLSILSKMFFFYSLPIHFYCSICSLCVVLTSKHRFIYTFTYCFYQSLQLSYTTMVYISVNTIALLALCIVTSVVRSMNRRRILCVDHNIFIWCRVSCFIFNLKR